MRRLCLPVGSEITPFSTASGERGNPQPSTVKVTFSEDQEYQPVAYPTGERYFCFPLPANPTAFDSYLCRVEDLVEE
jgi:hypothetical protein